MNSWGEWLWCTTQKGQDVLLHVWMTHASPPRTDRTKDWRRESQKLTASAGDLNRILQWKLWEGVKKVHDRLSWITAEVKLKKPPHRRLHLNFCVKSVEQTPNKKHSPQKGDALNNLYGCNLYLKLFWCLFVCFSFLYFYFWAVCLSQFSFCPDGGLLLFISTIISRLRTLPCILSYGLVDTETFWTEPVFMYLFYFISCYCIHSKCE